MIYTIFAGVNGAGKSSLYRCMNTKGLGVRINTDEIVRTLGSWNDTKLQFEAGKIAINLLRKAFDEKKSMNQETTLTGYSIIKNIIKAKDLGYRVCLHYVYVGSVNIAIKRVKERVLKGGHDIPIEDIKRRFVKSIDALREINHLCDELRIYDNSNTLTEIFTRVDSKIILSNKNHGLVLDLMQ